MDVYAEVADLAALRALGVKNDGDVAYVAKRSAADYNTDGGGIFQYLEADGDPDDDATIIAPSASPPTNDRWIRRVEDVRRAEWWGAKGDAFTNDIDAINSCLAKYGRVDLMAKDYLVRPKRGGAGYVNVKTLDQVRGQGIDKTKLVHAIEESPFWWSTDVNAASCFVIGNSTSPADNVLICDLTIDCGYNSSNKQITRKAIALTGANNLVERVKAVNFAVGKPSWQSPPLPAECFVIALTLTSGSPAADTDRIMGTIQDCEITEPGLNGDRTFTPPVPEITCLMIAGESNSKLGSCGIVRRNKLYNCKYDKNGQATGQQSPLHGITLACCTGGEVSENEVINFDGTAVFWMSWKDEDAIVRCNRFVNVNNGVAVCVMISGSPAAPTDDPFHVRAKIVGNTVLLGKYFSVSGNELLGIYAYIGCFSESPAYIRLEKLLIQGNFVRGGLTDYKNAFGVKLFFTGGPYDSVVVEDNVLETPDQGGTPTLSAAYENALWFGNRWCYDPRKVVLRRNRNASGNELRLKIVEYGASPSEAEWGPFETSVTRFQGLATDVPSPKVFDGFLGLAPTYALGWKDILGGSPLGSVSSVDGEEGLVGVAKLTAGASSQGSAVLRLGGTAAGGVLPFKLGSSAGRIHVFEFKLKRGMAYDANQKYQLRVGLMESTAAATSSWAPVGVYLKCQSSYEQNTIRGFAISSTSPLTYSSRTLWDDSTPAWRLVRMEVSGARVSFYVNGTYIDAIASNIPKTAGLLFAFCVHGETGSSVDRCVFLDSFSYEIT